MAAAGPEKGGFSRVSRTSEGTGKVSGPTTTRGEACRTACKAQSRSVFVPSESEALGTCPRRLDCPPATTTAAQENSGYSGRIGGIAAGDGEESLILTTREGGKDVNSIAIG